jgi:hypothetical protein
MLLLMLNPQFKSLCLVSSFVGREQGTFIIEEYDWKSLQRMLLKCFILILSCIILPMGKGVLKKRIFPLAFGMNFLQVGWN